MSNYAPIWLNFNGGEVSPAMRGRVDHEKYNSWCEKVRNFILTPQGMVSKRPGSIITGVCQDSDFDSELVPFEYSDSENYVLEFGKENIAFYTNDGLILEASGAGTVFSTTRIDKVAHGYVVGDLIHLSAMSASNMNGRVVKITSKTNDTFTFSATTLDVSSGSVTVARVYRIAHPYDEADLANLQFVQSGNVMRIFHRDYQPRKLTRISNASWTIAEEDYLDGPYLDVNAGQTQLALSGSGDFGRKVGVTVTASSGTAASAVDGNPGNRWVTATGADEWIKWDRGVGNTARIKGLLIFSGNVEPENDSPATWRFEGSNDNVTWTLLHTESVTEAWGPAEPRFMEIPLTPAYRYFRLFIEAPWNTAETNMSVGWVGLLAHPDYGGDTLTLTASSITDINGGAGFASTDVGRVIRFQTTRGYWVWGVITSYSSATSVGVQLQNFPFGDDFGKILTFQLGLYSGTTGWPDAGDYYQNRIAIGGSEPIRVGMSETDVYDSFKPTDAEGTVVDSDGINVRPTAKKADGAVWLVSMPNGVIVGTQSGEWVVQPATADRVLAPANVSAAEVTRIGSKTGIRPVVVDNAVLFIDKTGRALRELAYIFESDAYRAPSMNLLSDHLFTSTAVALAYQASPYSFAWAARADGELRALTYNRENDIVGWSTHALGGIGDSEGGAPQVTKLVAVTSTDGTADDLYMVVKRYIDGQTVRYIERLAPYFDDATEQNDAFFVDCGTTYSGAATNTVGDLWFLEGASVVALADGIVYDDLTVTDGEITLPGSAEASTISVGYRITSTLKTLPVRGGALDGTAQGRTKRTWQIMFDLWKTWGGSYGPDEDTLEVINFLDPFTAVDGEASPLFSGYKGPYAWPGGYEYGNAVTYQHSDPTPCNIRGLLPRNELTDHG